MGQGGKGAVHGCIYYSGVAVHGSSQKCLVKAAPRCRRVFACGGRVSLCLSVGTRFQAVLPSHTPSPVCPARGALPCPHGHGNSQGARRYHKAAQARISRSHRFVLQPTKPRIPRPSHHGASGPGGQGGCGTSIPSGRRHSVRPPQGAG